MAKTMDQYITDAKKQLQGSYESLKNQATTNYNNQQNTYNNQKTETAANYDGQVKTNQRNGVLNQNQYNNNTLSRGMARSSIATTGLAGIQNTTNRIEGELNAAKQSELSKVETLKSQLTDSFNSQMLGYDKELESKAQELANQLKQYDDTLAQQQWERDQAEKQAAEDKRRWELEYALKQQQMAAASSGGGGGGGYRSSGGGRSYSRGGSSKSSGNYESAASSNARILDIATKDPYWTNTVVNSPGFKETYSNQYGYQNWKKLSESTQKNRDQYYIKNAKGSKVKNQMAF